uniref:Uncharacterized protein LOC105036920 n=1 Tax=Elaeis guineensis var. tenera TaxID=51953 RepID=A0A6I9QNA5_ELAGV|nr:uncharacterized protein LOC105036920 [Elaeis guineensis]
MAVGIKQKTVVDQIVEKFFSSNFTIMLFHYDDVVDEWRDLQWSDSALHVSAINQTKYYISMIGKEGLETSQPVSDVAKLEVHHQITARGRQEDVQRQSQLIGVDGVCYYVLLVFSSFICCLTGFKLDRGRSFSASGSKISFSSF